MGAKIIIVTPDAISPASYVTNADQIGVKLLTYMDETEFRKKIKERFVNNLDFNIYSEGHFSAPFLLHWRFLNGFAPSKMQK